MSGSSFHGMPWYNEIGFGALTVRERIKPFEAGRDTWSTATAQQVQALLDNTGEPEESMVDMERLEVGLKGGGALLQLYFFPYEDGVVFLDGSVKQLGAFSQGGFEFEMWPKKRSDQVRAIRLLLDLAGTVNPVALADDSSDIGCFSPQDYLGEVIDEGVDLLGQPTMKSYLAECAKRGISIVDRAPDFAMYVKHKQLSDRVAKVVKASNIQAKAPAVLDEVAQWYSEDEYHKKLDPDLHNKVFERLLLPVLLETRECRAGWERLLPRHLPEEHDRDIISSIDPHRRAPWLDAHPQEGERQVDYIDLVEDADYIYKCLAPVYGKKQKTRRRNYKLLKLEKRILELAERLPAFAEAVERAG